MKGIELVKRFHSIRIITDVIKNKVAIIIDDCVKIDISKIDKSYRTVYDDGESSINTIVVYDYLREVYKIDLKNDNYNMVSCALIN